MLEFLIVSQFFSAIISALVGLGLLLIIRRKVQPNAKGDQAVGLWVRAICFGTDLAIIDILSSFLAYRGSLAISGYIIVLLTLSYFFFFWLYFCATPAQMIIRIKILSRNGGPLKVGQVLARLGMIVFLFVGWITILFDKKQKRALHDIVAQTHVVYTEKEIKTGRPGKKLRLIMLALITVLLVSLIVYGFGEKLTKYTENDQITFFDLNSDGLVDGLTMDVDKDGESEVFKYDLNNDRVVDFTTFDTDKDGVAESIDINNDGLIDGFDFDKDNVLDIPIAEGQFYIWLWRVWFSSWAVGFAALLIFAIIKENKTLQN